MARLRKLLFGLIASGVASVVLAGCGGGGGGVDKTPDQLNFSQASAADAGVYGADDQNPSSQYTSFDTVTDASGAISFKTPHEWSDLARDPAEFSDAPHFQAILAASPKLDDMFGGWDMPGGFVAVSKSLGVQVMDADVPEIAFDTAFAAVSQSEATQADCDAPETLSLGPPPPGAEVNPLQEVLADLVDFGRLDLYSNCGGNGTVFVEVGGISRAAKALLYAELTLTTEDDGKAAGTLLGSLAIEYDKVPAPTNAELGPAQTLP